MNRGPDEVHGLSRSHGDSWRMLSCANPAATGGQGATDSPAGACRDLFSIRGAAGAEN